MFVPELRNTMKFRKWVLILSGSKPILELNMKHALVKAVGRAQQAKNESDVNDLSALLFEQAQILDGELPDDPAAFAARVNRLVARSLGA